VRAVEKIGGAVDGLFNVRGSPVPRSRTRCMLVNLSYAPPGRPGFRAHEARGSHRSISSNRARLPRNIGKWMLTLTAR